MRAKAKEDFKNSDWDDLYPRLVRWAVYCIGWYGWNTPDGTLPLGKTAEDIVLGAIEKTWAHLETGEVGKGFRAWSYGKVSLPAHLMGVIKSDLNALVERDEHTSSEYFSSWISGEEEGALDDRIDRERFVAGEERHAGSELGAKELYDRMIGKVRIARRADADVLKYLDAFELAVKLSQAPTAEILCAHSGLNKNKVRNAKRKVERTIVDLGLGRRGARKNE